MARKPSRPTEPETVEVTVVETLPVPVTDQTQDAEAEPVKKVKSHSIVPRAYQRKYAKHGGTCGDHLSSVLTEATRTVKDGLVVTDLAAVHRICRENGIDPARWAIRNAGQQRMNLGNVLRGMVNRGERVVIAGTVISEGTEEA